MFTNRGAQMQSRVVTELTQELQRLLGVVLSGASDDEREAAVAEIEALLPRWRQAVSLDESDQEFMRGLR